MNITPPPLYQIITQVCWEYPQLVQYLEGLPRWVAMAAKALEEPEVKTERSFITQLTALVKQLYAGEIGGEFVDSMAAIISHQIVLAHREAWRDNGGKPGEFPDHLQTNADNMILREFDFVDAFYRSVIDARVDGTPIEPLLARVELWANRYNDAYSMAQLLIAEQQEAETGKQVRLVWRLGNTEEHCDICATLDGVVAPSAVWREALVYPQSGVDGNLPNPALVSHEAGQIGCGGWRCDCRLTQTDDESNVTDADELRGLIGWV